MAKDSLIKFSNAIINEADEQKRQLLNKIKSENQALIEDKKLELEKKKKACILSESEKTENRKKLALSAQTKELRTKLIAERSRLVSEMFENIREAVAEYTATDEYRTRLKSDYLKALKQLSGDDIHISAKPVDMEYLKSISQDTVKNITFETASDGILGGFTAASKKMRLFADYTLKSRLEEEKKSFVINSGFFID